MYVTQFNPQLECVSQDTTLPEICKCIGEDAKEDVKDVYDDVAWAGNLNIRKIGIDLGMEEKKLILFSRRQW